jgi:hypothetical protein
MIYNVIATVPHDAGERKALHGIFNSDLPPAKPGA